MFVRHGCSNYEEKKSQIWFVQNLALFCYLFNDHKSTGRHTSRQTKRILSDRKKKKTFKHAQRIKLSQSDDRWLGKRNQRQTGQNQFTKVIEK